MPSTTATHTSTATIHKSHLRDIELLMRLPHYGIAKHDYPNDSG